MKIERIFPRGRGLSMKDKGFVNLEGKVWSSRI
jgi:hypothetical protein